MSRAKQFVFESYEFSLPAKELKLFYSFDTGQKFCERFYFNFDFVEFDQSALERACQLLFLLAGVSYFKVFLPEQITVIPKIIDKQRQSFLQKTYQKGLGELFYRNGLDVDRPINFEINSESLNTLSISGQGQLVALGGGKDSLVSVDLLNKLPGLATWSVGHFQQLEPLVKKVGKPHFWVERIIDAQLLSLNNNSLAYNGHIPISAIFAAVGSVVAILSGYKDIVVSNEASANEPTLIYQDTAVNHQYSKSLEFEHDFQNLLAHEFGQSLRYYSALRPFSELRIAELFAAKSFKNYRRTFCSCNQAYLQTANAINWCGVCAKCVFTFLILTPFVKRKKLEDLWNGRNLLLDPRLEPIYRQLLGISGDKPLDCVGEIKESRTAMRMAQQQYPELSKYQFDLPADYDFRSLAEHSMPEEIAKVIYESI